MKLTQLDKIKIYKKNSLYADFLFSYPSTYVLKNKFPENIRFNILGKKNLLYVHIPFCFEICSFCNVNKTKLNNYSDIKNYLITLFDEIDTFLPKLGKNNYFEGVYIGGGTPTLLSVKDLELLFNKIFNSFNFKDNFSFEIDAHPSTITDDKLELLNSYGVKQISMGIQSMEDGVMDVINRKGQSYLLLEKLSCLLSNYDFNLHFDFIIGLPNETISVIKEDVCYVAEKFKPSSISINGYDNTIDTGLFKSNKDEFRTKDYKETTRANVKLITDLLKNKYGITRQLTFYFDNFFNNLYNVIGLGSGSYGYINGKGVYKNEDYNNYILNHSKKVFYNFSNYDERIMYIIHNYDKQDINDRYYSIFKSKIYDDFKFKIDLFIKRGYVKIKNDKVIFDFNNNSISKFELIELYSDNMLKLYE